MYKLFYLKTKIVWEKWNIKRQNILEIIFFMRLNNFNINTFGVIIMMDKNIYNMKY